MSEWKLSETAWFGSIDGNGWVEIPGTRCMNGIATLAPKPPYRWVMARELYPEERTIVEIDMLPLSEPPK